MTDLRKKRFRFAAYVVVVALVIRVGFILVWGSEEERYDALYDDLIYTDLAHQIISGYGYSLGHDHFVASAGEPTSIVEPAYPLMLATSYLLFGEHSLPVRLLQAVLGAVTCAFVYGIGRRATSEASGRVAALISAVYPLFVMYTRPLLTEIMSCFVLAVCVWQIYRLVERPSVWNFFLGGVLVGIGALTRRGILIYGALLTGYLCFLLWRRGERKALLTNISFLSIGCILVLSPWTMRNWRVHEVIVFSPNKRWGLWEKNHLRYLRETSSKWRALGMEWKKTALPKWDVLTEVERDKKLAAMNFEFIKTHPAVFSRYALTRVIASYPIVPRELLPPPIGYRGVRKRPDDGLPLSALDEFPLYCRLPGIIRVWTFRLVFLLALLAVGLVFHRKKLELVMPLLLLIGSNGLLAAIAQGKERARLPIDPYLIILAAHFVTYLWQVGHKAYTGSIPEREG